MSWKVIYHHDVAGDLEELGRSEAARIMRVIDERIRLGEPDKIGKPLYGSLAGYRRLRTGNMRIVYRVNADKIEVLVVAVGMRRNLEVYLKAERRLKE
jgi:mRNA interferase RelE/StbE